MTFFSRTMIAATAGLVLLGTASCGGEGLIGGGGEQEPPKETQPAAGLKDFDPCAFPKPDELAAFGVSAKGERDEKLDFEPGCEFEGEKMILALYKNQKESVASFGESESWGFYEKIKINGRNAANGVGGNFVGQGGCTTLVDAGDGVVKFMVTGIMKDDLPEPCAVSQKIATDLEPRLPK